MSKTTFFGLGGMQEIGKSTLAIENDNQIFIVDSGIKFANASVTGVKGIIPNYQYLKNNEEKIQGLFLTHGHEDHMGGIPFLVEMVNIPRIVAPRVGIHYLKNKFKERKIQTNIEFIEIEKDLKLNYDEVNIDFWTAQHSIPDAFGIRFSTPNGSLMFTGDFRFDYTPIGNLTDFTKLEEMGKEGLTALFSDSTNAMRPNHSPSEKDILTDIRKYMEQAQKKIIITAFASNMTRIAKLIELSASLNKKVICFGRSMIKSVEIARKIGFINVPEEVFVDKKNISKYDDSKLVIFTTGSQGEQMAALAKTAEKKHPQVKIKHGDLIIFSSSPIPGNRLKIELLVNDLFKLGAEIKENGVDGYLHTSGHAYREEHDKIFSLTKPKYFFPYHGEFRMNVVHGQTAIENGVKKDNVVVAQQGEVYEMKNGEIFKTKEIINVDPIYIDGEIATTLTTELIKERSNLGENGFVHVVVFINKKENKMAQRPKIITRGTLYVKNSLDVINETRKLVYGSVLYKIKNSPNYTSAQLKKLIKDRLQPFFYKTKRRRPVISSVIVYVDDLAIEPEPINNEIIES